MRYTQEHPSLGYHRLTWSMLDAAVAAASPSAGSDVLRSAGTFSRPPPSPRNAGTWTCAPWGEFRRWYVPVPVIDASSRSGVAWDRCWALADDAMALVLRQALEGTPGARPGIVPDTGAEGVGRDVPRACQAERLKHSRTRLHHPQASGRLERDLRPFREAGWAGQQPPEAPAASALRAEGGEQCNPVRLPRTLQSRTPGDSYRGTPGARLTDRRSRLPAARLRRRAAWEADTAPAPTPAA